MGNANKNTLMPVAQTAFFCHIKHKGLNLSNTA